MIQNNQKSIKGHNVSFQERLPTLSGALRLDGARGKKQVWRTNVRTWGLSEASVTVLKKILVTLLGLFGAPIVIRHSGSCPPLLPCSH